MWRNLSPREKAAMKQARNPLSKGITFLSILLLFLPIGFGIDNLITFILTGTVPAIIMLFADVVIAAVIIVATRKLKQLLNRDVDNSELQVCEAVIDRLSFESIDAVTIRSKRTVNSIAYYATVHPVDEPGTSYKVKIGVEFHSGHAAGDEVLLVCDKGAMSEENMQLLEGID